MPSINQLERLLAVDPKDPFVPYALALAYAKEARHDDAVASFDRCLGLDEAYLYAYYHKARSLEALGRVEEAREVLRTGADFARRGADSKALSEMRGYLGALRA